MTRTFDDKPAVRVQTPILCALVGPSSSGKTYSALRLATGMQRVSGGDIFVIDTEADRALHYADRFKFRHQPFAAPHSPLDYLSAIDHAVKRGAKTIVIDSMSHEHEGVGGVLEWHEQETGGDPAKNLPAWAKPKAARRKLINFILQIKANFVCCFRAKDKIEMVPGQKPVPLGFSVIGGEEWIYEMTMSALLMPISNGIPTWQSKLKGERLSIKLPGQFLSVFDPNTPEQITEEHGMKMAQWAAGGSVPTVASSEELLRRYDSCADSSTLRTLEQARTSLWSKLSKEEKVSSKAAADAAEKRVAAQDQAVAS